MVNIFANIGANVVYPFDQKMFSAFEQLLLKIVSESEKFCRVHGSSILTVKQSMKGCYWKAFVYSLLARVQEDTHTCTNTCFRLLNRYFSRSYRYLTNSVEFTAVQY